MLSLSANGSDTGIDLRRFQSAQNTPRPSLFKRLVNVARGLVKRRMVKYLGRR